MKGKRVLTLLLAAAVTFSNGSIVFAAESSSTEYTETTGMEAAVGRSTAVRRTDAGSKNRDRNGHGKTGRTGGSFGKHRGES